MLMKLTKGCQTRASKSQRNGMPKMCQILRNNSRDKKQNVRFLDHSDCHTTVLALIYGSLVV